MDGTPGTGSSGDLLPPGDEVLLRYRYPDGRFQAAFPMRVVRDEGTRLTCWLAPSTPIMYWACEDGTDPRHVPLSQRFSQVLTTAPRRWEGNGVLRVIPMDESYQVLHFWDDDGEFIGWYVNLETPKTRHNRRLDAVDWHLDLLIDPHGSPQWKDEEEALTAVSAGYLDPDDLAAGRAVGQRIIDETAVPHRHERFAPIEDVRRPR